MKCPRCDNPVFAVVETRPHEPTGGVKRKRKCKKCGYVARTIEQDEEALRIINKALGVLAGGRPDDS